MGEEGEEEDEEEEEERVGERRGGEAAAPRRRERVSINSVMYSCGVASISATIPHHDAHNSHTGRTSRGQLDRQRQRWIQLRS